MADKAKASASGGVGVFGLLGVAFVVLKLCHTIEWGWFFVLMPFWIPVALFVVIFLIALAFFVTVELLK